MRCAGIERAYTSLEPDKDVKLGTWARAKSRGLSTQARYCFFVADEDANLLKGQQYL